MNFCKIEYQATYAARKYFAFLRNIAIGLTVLGLAFFSPEMVIGETSSGHGNTPQQKQTNIPEKGDKAADQADYGKKSKEKSDYRNVRVGLYENKPKIFTDETGSPSGIFVDILNKIARKEKWQLTYVPCKWQGCLKALEQGRLDLMPDVAFSAKRDKRFDFHEEGVVSSWSAVYTSSGKKISKITDLEGLRIAVLEGSIQETVLKRLVKGFSIQVDFIRAPSFEKAFRRTADGTADAVVANHFFGNYFYQQYGLKKTPIAFNPVELYFATVSGANHELLKAIDEDLRALKSEPGSAYYEILRNWMEKPPEVIVPRYLVWTISGLSGILVLALVFIWLLRWQVTAKTRNLDHANQMLRDSELKFREIFHKHAAVKLLVDPDNGSIVEANEAAEKFYGWTGDQLRRMRVQDINTLSREQVKKEMEKAENLQRAQFEFQHRLADGSIRDVAVLSSKIDIQGKAYLHSIVHDITERKKAEKDREKLQAQFLQAQKMESIGRLAGGVAHDYNNMLSVIVGYTELALPKTDPSDPLHADLKEISNAAQRSISITRQLLAFARQQVAEPVILDLNRSVESMLQMLQRLIGENIELVWLPTPGLWPVEFDGSQMDQILANLCVNARDAIADVGKITIETDNVTIDSQYCAVHPDFCPGEYVLLAVTDDGCGMDRETLEHVFEPFFTTKDSAEGTGLGLATVYGIIKQNSGFVNVYSEPGAGTTFRIYIPRHEGEVDNTITESAEEIPQGHGEMVLLVDDDKSILQMGKRMLERLGYQALTADSADEAIRMAEAYGSGIDLLILDLIMPGMNGRDLADRLLAFCPGFKIMFMSGYAAGAIPQHAGKLDSDLIFLQKPFSVKELAVKVNKALGRE